MTLFLFCSNTLRNHSTPDSDRCGLRAGKLFLFWWKLILLIGMALEPGWAVTTSSSEAQTLPSFQIRQRAGTDLIEVTSFAAGSHRLEIDDAPRFRTPLLSRALTAGPQGRATLQLHANEAGLVPGVPYYFRLDGKAPVEAFDLAVIASPEPELNCAMLRRTWERTGRLTVGVAFSRLRWDTATARWTAIPHTGPIGDALYNAGLVLRPVLAGARACGDVQTMDEVAQYYIKMLDETETVEALLKGPRVPRDSIDRLTRTDHTARTFAAPFGNNEIGEGELYNSQWLHPAAYLLRMISILPEERRTRAMQSFAAQYTAFLVNEQLRRFLVQQQLPALGGHVPSGRIEHWKLILQGNKGVLPWEVAMSDIDLWLISSAAEVLGAHANDPALVPLDGGQLSMLHMAVDVGIRFFQSKRTLYPDTKNFQTQAVGSASYFNGDYTALEEYKYSAYDGEKFPSAFDQRTRADASWDMEHMYRVPVFLRELYENRKATGADFPRFHDLELVVNQYLYRVFNGDYARPLFRNNFDGSDGWFRVGFNGAGTAHPPSAYCSMQDVKRLCMVPGTTLGWPLLSFVNPDLMRLEQSLLTMALDESLEKRGFRDRFYSGAYPFQVIMVDGERVYGGAFYLLAAENAERLQKLPGDAKRVLPQ